MKILYIWDSDYPWDVRAEKICKSLIARGHEAHIAARNLKNRPAYELEDGLHIHRLKSLKQHGLNYAWSFPAFFSPVWKRFLDRLIKENKIDLVMVRDLPLAVAGIRAGRRHRIPVVLDMAEDYLAMIWDIWRARKFSGFNLVVRNPYLAKSVERYTFKHIDHVLVVVEEAKAVVARGGGNPQNATVVSNTPVLSAFDDRGAPLDRHGSSIAKRFSAIYTGGIQLGRGLQTVFDAMPEIIKAIPDFLFVVVGDGYATSALKGMIADRGLEEHVLWIGWVEHRKIFDYIRASNIGLIPHFVTDHVNTTMPNKIFDYMGCGLPVLCSDSIPMRRIVEEERCGLVFKSGDAQDLARCIIRMHASRGPSGEQGAAAVRKKYNWSEDERRLLEVVLSMKEKGAHSV